MLVEYNMLVEVSSDNGHHYSLIRASDRHAIRAYLRTLAKN
jgi:hypothetical protein